MVTKSSGPRRFLVFGYTLIELMMVMFVIAALAGMTFYALKAYNNSQIYQNAALEFVSDLRSLQNEASVGANGWNNVYIKIDENLKRHFIRGLFLQ